MVNAILVGILEAAVDDGPGSLFALRYDSSRGNAKVFVVSGSFVRKNYPVSHLGVVIHVGQDELGIKF